MFTCAPFSRGCGIRGIHLGLVCLVVSFLVPHLEGKHVADVLASSYGSDEAPQGGLA